MPRSNQTGLRPPGHGASGDIQDQELTSIRDSESTTRRSHEIIAHSRHLPRLGGCARAKTVGPTPTSSARCKCRPVSSGMLRLPHPASRTRCLPDRSGWRAVRVVDGAFQPLPATCWTLASSAPTRLRPRCPIRSEDPYTEIPRTRADRPFEWRSPSMACLHGATDPDASKSVKLLRHVQSYGVKGTGRPH